MSDFARAAVAGQPFDVASSDRHTVKPWLAGRTTVSADIVDLAAQGFPLAGGRVSVVDRVPAPTLVYRHNEHVVAVTELPLDARGRARRRAATIDGYHVARWSRRQPRLCRRLRHGRKDARRVRLGVARGAEGDARARAARDERGALATLSAKSLKTNDLSIGNWSRRGISH